MKLATGSVGAGLEAKRRHRGDPSHLVQVQQGLVQHPLRAQMLLFGGFQFIWRKTQRDEGYQANRGGFGRGKALAPGWVCGEALGLPGLRVLPVDVTVPSVLFHVVCMQVRSPASPQPAPRGPASRGHTRSDPRLDWRPGAGQRCQAGHRHRRHRAGSGQGERSRSQSEAERVCCDCPGPRAGDSHVFP